MLAFNGASIQKGEIRRSGLNCLALAPHADGGQSICSKMAWSVKDVSKSGIDAIGRKLGTPGSSLSDEDVEQISGVPASRNSGVWASTPGGIIPILITGQQLDFHGRAKTVKSIQIFEQAGGAMGQSRSFDAGTGKLVYQATFDDGTWGIYQAALPD